MQFDPSAPQPPLDPTPPAPLPSSGPPSQAQGQPAGPLVAALPAGPVGHAPATAIRHPDPSNPTGYVLDKLKTDNPGVADDQLLAMIRNVEITPRTTASREGSGLLFHSYEHPTGSGNRFVKSEVTVRCTITKPTGEEETLEHTLPMFTAVKWPTNEGERRAASEKLGRIAKGYCHFHTNVLDPTKRTATAGLAQKVADIAAGGAVRVGSPHGPGKKEPLSAVRLTWGSTLESTEVTITQRVDGLRHIITDQAYGTVEMSTVAPQEAGTKAVGSYIRETDSHLVRRDEFHDSSDPYLMLKAKGAGIKLTDFDGDNTAVEAHAERLLEEVRADGSQAEQTAQRMLSRQEPGRIGKLLKRKATWERSEVVTLFKAQVKDLEKAKAKLKKLQDKRQPDDQKIFTQRQKVAALEKDVAKRKQEFDSALPVLRSAAHAQRFKVEQLNALHSSADVGSALQDSLSTTLAEARAILRQTETLATKISDLTGARSTAAPATAEQSVELSVRILNGALAASSRAVAQFEERVDQAEAACTQFDQLHAEFEFYVTEDHPQAARQLYNRNFARRAATAQRTFQAADLARSELSDQADKLQRAINQLADLRNPGPVVQQRLTEARQAHERLLDVLIKAGAGTTETPGRMAGLDVSQAVADLQQAFTELPPAVQPGAAQAGAPGQEVGPPEGLDQLAQARRTSRVRAAAGPSEATKRELGDIQRLSSEIDRDVAPKIPQMQAARDQFVGLRTQFNQLQTFIENEQWDEARAAYERYQQLAPEALTAARSAAENWNDLQPNLERLQDHEHTLARAQTGVRPAEIERARGQIEKATERLGSVYWVTSPTPVDTAVAVTELVRELEDWTRTLQEQMQQAPEPSQPQTAASTIAAGPTTSRAQTDPSTEPPAGGRRLSDDTPPVNPSNPRRESSILEGAADPAAEMGGGNL